MFAEPQAPVKDPPKLFAAVADERRWRVESDPLSHPRSKLMSMTATLDFFPDHRRGDSAPSTDFSDSIDSTGEARSTPPTLLINGLLAVVVGVVIVVVAIGFGSGAAATGPDGPASADDGPPAVALEPTFEVYVVQPGDTLWAIAQRITPVGNDLRPTIDYLSSISGGAELDVGQRIMIDHSELVSS